MGGGDGGVGFRVRGSGFRMSGEMGRGGGTGEGLLTTDNGLLVEEGEGFERVRGSGFRFFSAGEGEVVFFGRRSSSMASRRVSREGRLRRWNLMSASLISTTTSRAQRMKSRTDSIRDSLFKGWANSCMKLMSEDNESKREIGRRGGYAGFCAVLLTGEANLRYCASLIVLQVCQKLWILDQHGV